MIVWQILAVVLVFGGVIFIHELGHFLAAKRSGVRVNEFAMGMGPKLFGFTRGDTTYCLRLLPIGGACVMEGEDEDSDDEHSFLRAKVWKRIIIIIAGAVMNLALGYVILFGITVAEPEILTCTVAGTRAGSAAEAAGLMAGDKIIAVAGRRVSVIDDLNYELSYILDSKTDVLVVRNGEKKLIEGVQLLEQVENDQGETVLKAGIWVEALDNNIWRSLGEAGKLTVSTTRTIFRTLIDLVTGRIPLSQLSGPVGIVDATAQATKLGFSYVLNLMALITINLGIFNLLPLPALDGGRLVFLLFEAVTRKRLKAKYEAIVHLVGIILLFALMIFVTFNDVTRLFTK